MAIVVESVSTRAWAVPNGSAQVILSAPSGVVAGNTLIAVLANEQARTVSSPPSGWSFIDSEIGPGSGGGGSETTLFIYAKVATGSDSYTWTVSSTAGQWGGGVLRVSGLGDYETSLGASVIDDATPSYPIGITPSTTDSLLIFAACTKGNSTSGYAIANDNPTWTERIDLDGTEAQFAVATAVREQTTATGNASLTIDSGGTPDSVAILAAFAPAAEADASNALAFGHAF